MLRYLGWERNDVVFSLALAHIVGNNVFVINGYVSVQVNFFNATYATIVSEIDKSLTED